MEAKQSSVGFPSTNFKFVAPKIDAVGLTDGTFTSRNALPFHTSETMKNSVSKGTVIKKQLRNTRPFSTRNVSLDNIAETIEGSRRPPLNTKSKENVPLEPASSPITGTRLLPAATPIKRVSLSTFNTPPATALWTRMLSSPPTPLSPINRRRSTPLANVGRCVSLSQTLELACAKARGSDRPCGEASGGEKQTYLSRPRTVSAQKRHREEIENDGPRKRATVTELDQKTRTDLWTGLDGQYSKTWRVASWRSSCATLNIGDISSSLNDEEAIPEDTVMSSSPSPIVVERVSAEPVTSPVGHASVAKPDDGVLDLADLEANAALVLASLFTV
jgi:hypothetical protein